VPTKDRIEWPYVTLLGRNSSDGCGSPSFVAGLGRLLIFAVLWLGFRIWPKTRR
jgi:hypothetical protein